MSAGDVIADGVRHARAILLQVAGRPAPKGSGRAIMRGGRAIHVPSGSDVNRANLQSWDQAVRLAANEAILGANSPPFVDVPIAVSVTFRMARPSGHWRKKGGLKPSAPRFPASKPDLDKLARATADSLKGVVYDDDSRIVALTLRKAYAAPGQEGASIVVEAFGEAAEPPF